MKFLFTATILETGGFSSYILNLGKALQAEGHEVQVLSMEPYGKMFDVVSESYGGVYVCKRGWETKTAYVARLAATIDRLAPHVLVNNADVYVQAAFALIRSETVRISVVHNVEYSEIKIALGYSKSVDALISVSDNVGEAIIKHGAELIAAHAVKTLVVPVGVDVPALTPKMGLGRPIKIVSFGRLAEQKNIEGLCEVIDRCFVSGRKVEFTIIGDGIKRTYIETFLQNKAYRDNVKMLGFRPPAELKEVLKNQDVYVMTSFYEGTPHAILEAMAAGVVVVASKIAGSTDRIIVNKKNGLLCDINDLGSYLTALDFIAADSEAFLSMRSKAWTYVRENYSIQGVSSRLGDLITSITKPGRPERCLGKKYLVEHQSENLPPALRHLRHLIADVFKRVLKNRKPRPYLNA